MIIKNIIEILKKNKILFFLCLIFFTVTPYFLIDYQENKTQNMYVSSIKIFEDYDNTVTINFIIEKFKTHNRILQESSINVIQPSSNKINSDNMPSVNIIDKDGILITYESKTTEIEVNNFKRNYLSLLFKELNSIGSELDFENEYNYLIQKYFKENNFDLEYFINYTKNITIRHDNDINYIYFEKFNKNHNEFINT